MEIKICGITTLEDAQTAIEAGADMLGFNFYTKSPRYVTPEVCAAIQSKITGRKPAITGVGVFVNSSPEEVTAILERTGLQLAQLSGDEPLSDLVALKERAFKSVRLSASQRESIPLLFVDYIKARLGYPPTLLVDAAVKGEYGGTGVTADWVAAAKLARRVPLLLAGGLSPENVAAAVRQVYPWGVDVASGVESSPGKKDAAKVCQFIQNARAAFRETIQIVPVSKTDLPEILALQKLAYQSEAELNNDFNIPPLRQTLSELKREFNDKLILKAVIDENIVGSARGVLQQNTCLIGRVIVHPAWQNCGIGSRLMEAIERRFIGAKRFELFTSERSVRNLYLYQKLGYRIFGRERLDEHVNLVYLEKMA